MAVSKKGVQETPEGDTLPADEQTLPVDPDVADASKMTVPALEGSDPHKGQGGQFVEIGGGVRIPASETK